MLWDAKVCRVEYFESADPAIWRSRCKMFSKVARCCVAKPLTSERMPVGVWRPTRRYAIDDQPAALGSTHPVPSAHRRERLARKPAAYRSWSGSSRGSPRLMSLSIFLGRADPAQANRAAGGSTLHAAAISHLPASPSRPNTEGCGSNPEHSVRIRILRAADTIAGPGRHGGGAFLWAVGAPGAANARPRACSPR